VGEIARRLRQVHALVDDAARLVNRTLGNLQRLEVAQLLDRPSGKLGALSVDAFGAEVTVALGTRAGGVDAGVEGIDRVQKLVQVVCRSICRS
jgi:hypothetical protein